MPAATAAELIQRVSAACSSGLSSVLIFGMTYLLGPRSGPVPRSPGPDRPPAPPATPVAPGRRRYPALSRDHLKQMGAGCHPGLQAASDRRGPDASPPHA